MARRRIKQVVTARAARFGVTSLQFWLIVGLYEGRSQSLRQLSARTRTDDPTASRVVQTLVGAGLVATAPDETDRRRARLTLTERGRELGVSLLEEAQAIRAQIERDLTAEELVVARVVMHKVIQAMEPEPEGGGEPT
jgi:DNA-binding MarR family transcriptional regulator